MRSILCFLLVFCIAVVATVGCGGTSRLMLDSNAGVLPSTNRPPSLAPSDSLTSECRGVRFEDGQWEVQCLDMMTYIGIRYDADFSRESCRETLDPYGKRVSSLNGEGFSSVSPSYAFRIDAARIQRVSDTDAERYSVALCVPHKDGGLALFMGFPVVPVDLETVRETMAAVAFDGMPATRLSPRMPRTTPLLGRSLQVPGTCRFMGAQNLSCYPYGQMDWSRFSSMDRARQVMDMKISAGKEQAASVVTDTTVACTLEGAETTCRRILYKATATRIPTLGASNRLIVYYAAARVRGTPSQVTCSFFDDQAGPNGLAMLCRESFDVPSAPSLMDQRDSN